MLNGSCACLLLLVLLHPGDCTPCGWSRAPKRRRSLRPKAPVTRPVTPSQALRSIGTGVKDLFYLPAKAVVDKPRGLGRAMAAGGASFARHSMLAAVRPVKQVVGGLHRTTEGALAGIGLAPMASHSGRSRRKLLDGTTGLGYGVLEGAVGLVREPYRGARKHGASGFVKGVGKGIMGAAIRPTAGVLKFAERWAGALQHASGENDANSTHSARVGLFRPPRMLHGEMHRIAPYSIAEALARHVLQSAEEGKYMHEPLVHCDLLGHVSEEGRSETVVIVVLTGLRLLTVDATSWRVQLNLQLRKVQSVYQDGSSNVLVLHLMPRRRQNAEAKPQSTEGSSGGAAASSGGGSGGGGGAPAGGAGGETRRLLCHTEEATAVMLAQLQARSRRALHTSPAMQITYALPTQPTRPRCTSPTSPTSPTSLTSPAF